jgi:hypothetical protein
LPLPAYSPDTAGELPPLQAGYLEPGGVLELWEKLPDGTLSRVAFMNNVKAGLLPKFMLLSLDTLDFAVPHDLFSPSTGDYLSRQAALWRTDNPTDVRTPFDKGSAVGDHLRLHYVTSAREHRYQILTLDFDDYTNLSGVAIDAAVDLSNYLTQYTPGASIYAGAPPSQIAERNLKGHQTVRIPNRRFIRDTAPAMTLAREIPDQTPDENSQISPRGYPVTPERPLPYVVSLPAAVPSSLDAFSGLPVDTVGPDGNAKARTSGSVGYHGFNDALDPVGQFALRRFGQFLRPANTARTFAGPLNWTVANTSPFLSGENNRWTSRVIYGAIRADVDGFHQFKLTTTPGHRVYFRGSQIIDALVPNITVVSVWYATLKAGWWYPFVIHHATAAAGASVLLQWRQPADTVYSTLPATNLTHQMHGGLFTVRFTDVQSVTRFLLCYKAWDGKSLMLAYPLPATVFSSILTNGSDWPKALPAGALMEEVSFPKVGDNSRVVTWGSGWTRIPGNQSIANAVLESSRFQPSASGY